MLLRFYACLFALILGLFMSGVSLVLLFSGSTNVKLDMMPFAKGDSALYCLLVLGLVGIAGALLGLIRKAKGLLVLFTAAAFCLLVYGFFMNGAYRFQGAAEAKSILWVSLAALCAVVGALLQFKERQRA